MKVIVAGPRDLIPREYEILKAMMMAPFPLSELVVGDATGVDATAHGIFLSYGFKTTAFVADWEKHGKAAGPIRNKQMAEYGDALVVIKRKGKSTPGTANMVGTALAQGIPVFVYVVEGTYPEKEEVA